MPRGSRASRRIAWAGTSCIVSRSRSSHNDLHVAGVRQRVRSPRAWPLVDRDRRRAADDHQQHAGVPRSLAGDPACPPPSRRAPCRPSPDSSGRGRCRGACRALGDGGQGSGVRRIDRESARPLVTRAHPDACTQAACGCTASMPAGGVARLVDARSWCRLLCDHDDCLVVSCLSSGCAEGRRGGGGGVSVDRAAVHGPTPAACYYFDGRRLSRRGEARRARACHLACSYAPSIRV